MPRRQTRMASVAVVAATRAHHHALRLGAAWSAIVTAAPAGRHGRRGRPTARPPPAPGAVRDRRRPRPPVPAPARRPPRSSPRTTRPSARRRPHPGATGSVATSTSAPVPLSASTAAAAASGPSRRRWWALKAAATSASRGSAGRRLTRPTTVSASNIGHPAAVHARSIRARSSAARMSSSAEATMRLAPARSPFASRVTSDCRVSTVTARPGGMAAAHSRRSASRSCTTQCCGPCRRGASQRPIAPSPPPRSWMTRRPAAGR